MLPAGAIPCSAPDRVDFLSDVLSASSDIGLSLLPAGRRPEETHEYKGHEASGEFLKQQRANYNVAVLAPESVEAAESAAAEAVTAEAAEEEPGLTPREAGRSLLEIHAVAHTRNDALPCLFFGWSDTASRLLTPDSGPLALMLLTHRGRHRGTPELGRSFIRDCAKIPVDYT